MGWKKFLAVGILPGTGVKVYPFEGVFVVLDLREAIWGVVNNLAKVPTRRFRGLGLIPFQINEFSLCRNSAGKGNNVFDILRSVHDFTRLMIGLKAQSRRKIKGDRVSP